MSKKVTRRASITNQSTCGGPKKAGLAPRSTNFMMGVKRNHNYAPGQSFVDNKNSLDYACNNTVTISELQKMFPQHIRKDYDEYNELYYSVIKDFTLEKNLTLKLEYRELYINAGVEFNIEGKVINNATISTIIGSGNQKGVINVKESGNLQNNFSFQNNGLLSVSGVFYNNANTHFKNGYTSNTVGEIVINEKGSFINLGKLNNGLEDGYDSLIGSDPPINLITVHGKFNNFFNSKLNNNNGKITITETGLITNTTSDINSTSGEIINQGEVQNNFGNIIIDGGFFKNDSEGNVINNGGNIYKCTGAHVVINSDVNIQDGCP